MRLQHLNEAYYYCALATLVSTQTGMTLALAHANSTTRNVLINAMLRSVTPPNSHTEHSHVRDKRSAAAYERPEPFLFGVCVA